MNKTKLQKYLPVIAVALTVLYFYFGYCMGQTSRSGDFDYHRFSLIPVLAEGRYKPIDTVARSSLMVITHRQTYYDYKTETRYPATKWLLDVLTTPPPSEDDYLEELFPGGTENRPAWKQEVFRIENDELLRFLNLKPRDGLRYSFMEIAEDRVRFQAFLKEIQRVRAMDPKQHKLLDAKIAELSEHLHLLVRLSAHASPMVVPDPEGGDQWKTFHDALDEYGVNRTDLPGTVDATSFGYYRALLHHYDQKDKIAFNSTLKKYLAYLEAQGKMGNSEIEVFFNEFQPFFWCLVLYAILAVVVAVSWLIPEWTHSIRRAAFGSMAVAFLVQLSGLILRMHLQERYFVFVTNLYSSAVFIGLGCVFVCLIAEWFYRNGIAIVVGSVTGFCTLIIAHILGMDGDTMVMLQAVLDTNFWLATHVTCVTLGYTMAFVAGFMGLSYILLGMFTDMLRKEGSANLTRMTYGVLCAGMFLSFVGTVLGGLWADYSWGRFWGWDPKENGALLIVIWISLILHARWGGLVKHRGIAVLSVLGIIVTSWSWFGTNFLGVGLHAYGGAKGGAMQGMILIDLGFLAIALAGAFVPLEMWQSFTPQPGADAPLKQSTAARTAAVSNAS